MSDRSSRGRLRPARIANRGARLLDDVRRRLTASDRVLPDFLIIGAQKAGTTSLYHYLAQHPNVLPLEWKEVHYFDNAFERSPLWYRAHFPRREALAALAEKVSGPALTGEATPFYMFHPDGPRRIRSLLPDAKLIVLLREPVARAFSHYHHERRKGVESLSFEEAVAREPERLRAELERVGEGAYDDPTSLQRHASYLTRGEYARQLERAYAHFDRRQVLVLFSEDLFRDPHGVYERTTSFLGLPPQPLRNVEPRNTGGYSTARIPRADELAQHFAGPNEELSSLLGVRPPW